jgi:SAM-dependent methyltransferase
MRIMTGTQPDGSAEINWSEVWGRQMQAASFRQLGKTWEERAGVWQHALSQVNRGDFAEQLLRRIHLEPDWTVLDVGCGNGLLSLPLAERAQRVTALDQAPAMIELTRRNAEAAGVDNVDTIVADWVEVEVGRDVQPHDIVVSSRSLLMLDLDRFLNNLDLAGSQRCYVAWWTGENTDVDEAVAEVLGEAYQPQPSYIVAYNALYDLGIRADVEIYAVEDVRQYASLDAGAASLARTRIVDQPTTDRLKERFGGRFSFEDGRYWWRISSTWALMSWQPRSH